MFGLSFCRAGREAFSMLCLHPMQLFAINSVGDFVLFLGKALVVMATVLIGVEMLEVSRTNSDNSPPNFYLILRNSMNVKNGLFA